jgi:DNA invertase Pin-like site-specific DNA recombinase
MVKSNNEKQSRAKTAVSYIRATTVIHSKMSISLQHEAITNKAQELKTKTVKEFADISTPANPAKRPGWQKMMEYLSANKTDYVIFHDVGRLNRNKDTADKMVSDIKKTGATPIPASVARLWGMHLSKQF